MQTSFSEEQPEPKEIRNAYAWTSNKAVSQYTQCVTNTYDFSNQATLISESDIQKYTQFESAYDQFLKEKEEFEKYKKSQLVEFESHRQRITTMTSDLKAQEHQIQRQKTDIEIQSQKLKVQTDQISMTLKQFEQREAKNVQLESQLSK